MTMEMTKKNSEGEVTGKRGRRREVVDGKLRNQVVDPETGEWVDIEVEAQS